MLYIVHVKHVVKHTASAENALKCCC